MGNWRKIDSFTIRGIPIFWISAPIVSYDVCLMSQSSGQGQKALGACSAQGSNNKLMVYRTTHSPLSLLSSALVHSTLVHHLLVTLLGLRVGVPSYLSPWLWVHSPTQCWSISSLSYEITSIFHCERKGMFNSLEKKGPSPGKFRKLHQLPAMSKPGGQCVTLLAY